MGALPHPQLWSLHPLFTLCFWPISFSSGPRMPTKCMLDLLILLYVLFHFPLVVSTFSLYFPFRWFSLIHFQGNWFFPQLSSLMINLLKELFIFVIFKFLAFEADSSIQPLPQEPLKILILISLNSLMIVPTTVSQLALMIVSSPKVLSLQTMYFAFS